MARFKATLDIYIDLDDATDADGTMADGISAMMENIQQATHEAKDGFVLVDWSYHPRGTDYSHGYAKPFEGETPSEQYSGKAA